MEVIAAIAAGFITLGVGVLLVAFIDTRNAREREASRQADANRYMTLQIQDDATRTRHDLYALRQKLRDLDFRRRADIMRAELKVRRRNKAVLRLTAHQIRPSKRLTGV